MTLYYSCDSHVVEPPEVFLGLEQFGSRAPQIVKEYKGKKGEFVVMPGGVSVPVGRFGIAGNRLDDPATWERIHKGYEGLNPGVLDPDIRLTEQDKDGIVGEVMYPSINMLSFSLKDRDVVQAVFRQHNDWVVDYCSGAGDRLIGIGCLPLPDVAEAIEEMHRAVNKGVRGFAIPCTAPLDKPYSHPDYDPFWAVAEEYGVPLTMHIFTGSTWDMGLPAQWGPPGTAIAGYTLAHSAVCATIIDIISQGVVERFPGLRFVIAEFETGWVAHFLQRMDHAVYREREKASADLKMEPSDYFRRNFRITFEDDMAGVLTRDLIGVDCMVWGNDYPHHDSIWPNSMRTLNEIFDGIPEADVERFVWKNCMELYGIDADALAKSVA